MTHVMVWRGQLPEDGLAGFWHHGILCGDGESVVHYAGMNGVKTFANARIMRTALAEFQDDPTRPLHIVTYSPALHPVVYAPADVEARAEARMGHAQYDLLADNCETFARWCVTGREVSQQSTGAVLGVTAGVVSILCGGGPLGALLTAFVTHKIWDRRSNRSVNRAPPPDDDDAHLALLRAPRARITVGEAAHVPPHRRQATAAESLASIEAIALAGSAVAPEQDRPS
jgi:hypothetical protein